MTAFTTIAPVFGLMAIGWLAAVARLISVKVSEGVSEYVFAIAVPALIVSTLVKPSLSGDIVPGYWLAYFGGAAIAWAAAWAAARRPRAGRDRRAAIAQGFAACQSNTVFVGVPLILQAYGDEGALPLFLLIAVHLPIMMGCGTVLMEADGSRPLLAQLGTLVRTLSRNPIIQSVVAGLVLKGAGIVPAGIPKTLLDGVAASASPCALIALGASLRHLGNRHDLPSAGLISAVKLLVHPLAVWFLAFHVFTMPPAYAGVATLFAAMPVGINAYLLAARYEAGPGAISTAVVLSTPLAAFTSLIWLALLGRL